MLSISVLLVVVILVGQVICSTNKLDVIVSKNCAVWVSISVYNYNTIQLLQYNTIQFNYYYYAGVIVPQ